ncbi:MAG: TA system VapC family ribonuclease toxin [Geodermatophilaceae bacterium]|jgi:toxin-antitoxin system PIN domain toxin|nr:PIN domain-containing protein [Geodermatophilaceae bacterium]
MLVDANLLLYAVDQSSLHHAAAAAWLESSLNGSRRVALPWLTLSAFVRISTNPRAREHPLDPGTAIGFVQEWLDAEMSWVPSPGSGFATAFLGLVTKYQLRGNLVSDAQLAALALENGLAVYSADTDFARFNEVTWVNPVAP